MAESNPHSPNRRPRGPCAGRTFPRWDEPARSQARSAHRPFGSTLSDTSPVPVLYPLPRRPAGQRGRRVWSSGWPASTVVNPGDGWPRRPRPPGSYAKARVPCRPLLVPESPGQVTDQTRLPSTFSMALPRST